MNEEVDVITKKVKKDLVKPVEDEVKKISTEVVDHTVDKVKKASEEVVDDSTKKVEENIVKPTIKETENAANRVVEKAAKTFSGSIRSIIGPIWDWLKWVVLGLGVLIVVLIITSIVNMFRG